MSHSVIVPITLVFTLACTSDPTDDDEVGTTTSPSTTEAGESSDDSQVFVDTGDSGSGPNCDPWTQDCPEGEKCVPYASNGGTWDSLECVPILGDEAAGEPCIYDGPLESTDDCDGTGWCFDVDENGEGTCHPFCKGTADMPQCPPMSVCAINGSGGLNICIPTCDPLAQNCLSDEGCYWTGARFECIHAAGSIIPTGEVCGPLIDCLPGNTCIDGSVLPACEGQSCCTNFCDLGLGDAQCDDLPGTMCVAFFEQGTAPLGYEQLGLCADT
jgi:hypothetical protein